MADANSTRYSKLSIEDKSPAELAEEFPINCDPCSVWFDYDQKEGRASWTVNDENGDAIDVPNYESAVKVAAAFSRKEHISLENYDIASVKAQQLDALIAAIVGEGFEHFKNLNDDVQHWYLMAISEHAMDIKRAISGRELSGELLDHDYHGSKDARAGAKACIGFLQAIDAMPTTNNFVAYSEACVSMALEASGAQGSFMRGFISAFAQYAAEINDAGMLTNMADFVPDAMLTDAEIALRRANESNELHEETI